MANPIPLIGPDGRKYEMPGDDPANLADVIKLGYRVETPETPSTLGEDALGVTNAVADTTQAAYEGVKDAATFGLLGKTGRDINAKLHPEDKAKLARENELEAGRAEASPVAHGVGEFAGMVLNPAGDIGGSIKATSTLGKIGAHAVGGGGFGLLQGAADTIDESVLGDTPLTAEKVISSVGLPTVLGILGGGVFGAIGETASKVVPKLAKTLGASADGLEEFANNKALNQAGAVKRDLDFLGEKRAQEAGKALLERGHMGEGYSAPTAKGVLESVEKDRAGVGKEVGAIFEKLKSEGAAPDFASSIKAVDDFGASLPPLEREAISSDLAATRRALEEHAGVGAGFDELNTLKKNLQDKAKWSDASEEFAGKLKRQLSGVVREDIEKQVSAISPELGQHLAQTNHLYSVLSDAARVAEHGAERLKGNGWFGVRDALLAAGPLAHGNVPAAMISAIASKVMRDRGSGVIARLASKLADNPAMSAVATSFAQKAATLEPALGKYGAILAKAAANTPQEALATHMVMAQADPHYAEAAQMAGLVAPSSPEQQTAGVAKAHGMAQLAASVAAHDEDVDRHIARAIKGNDKTQSTKLGSTDFSGKRSRATGRDLHIKRAEEIRQLATDPQALVDRISKSTGNLAGIAPTLTGAVTSTANLAVQYLAMAAQEPLKAGPLAADWHHTEEEQRVFARKLAVVEDPMVALRHAASRTLTPDDIEAFQAVYPTLAREVADKVIAKITESPKSVPYGQRIMLSLLTGIDLDGTMSPQAIAANQAAIASSSVKPSNAGMPGSAKSQKGADALSVGSRMAPESERQREA